MSHALRILASALLIGSPRNGSATTGGTGGGGGGGKGHNGGVWEWTSTVLDKHDGFVPSRLYPGYSTDFFDSHHQVVVRVVSFLFLSLSVALELIQLLF